MGDDQNRLSGSVGLDTTDYKAGVAELNRQIKVIETGFRASAAAMGDWDKTSDGLTQRQKALSQEIDLQKQKVAALTAEYEKVVAEKGADSRAAEDLQIKINNQNKTLGDMQTELAQTNTSLDEAGKNSKTAGDDIETLGNKSQSSAPKLQGLKTVLSDLGKVAIGVVTAVAGIGGAVAALVLKSSSSAKSLQDLSDRTGLSVEQLQVLDYTGKQVGVDLDTITSVNTKLIRSMSGVQNEVGNYNAKLEDAYKKGENMTTVQAKLDVGMSKTWKAFNQLGVAVVDSNGNLRDSRVVFDEAIAALGKIPDQTTRDALAMQIFGKSAQDLEPLIKAGSAGLAQMALDAHNLGAVMSDQDVQSLAGFSNILDGLKSGFQGITGTLATAFLPGFKDVAGKAGDYLGQFSSIVKGSNGDLGKMASGVGALLGQILTDLGQQGPKMLQGGLNILQGIIKGLVSSLPVLLPAVVKMIQELAEFLVQSLQLLLPAVLQILIALATMLIQQLPMLIDATVQIILALALGITQALPQLIPAIVQIIPQIITILVQNLPLLIKAALQLIVALAQGLIAALPVLIPQIPVIVVAIFNALIAALPMIGNAALQLISTLVDGIVTNLPMLGAATGQVIDAVVMGVAALASKIVDVGKSIVEGIWAGIQANAAWFTDQVKQFFTNIVDGVKKALGIHSPSTVFAEIGQNMALGLGNGFSQQMAAVTRQIQGTLNGFNAASIPVNVNASMSGSGAQQVVSANGKTYQVFFETFNEVQLNRYLRQSEMLYGQS